MPIGGGERYDIDTNLWQPISGGPGADVLTGSPMADVLEGDGRDENYDQFPDPGGNDLPDSIT